MTEQPGATAGDEFVELAKRGYASGEEPIDLVSMAPPPSGPAPGAQSRAPDASQQPSASTHTQAADD